MPRHEDIEQFKRVLASYGAGPAERTGTLTAGSARPAAADVEAEPFEAPDDLGDLGDLGDTGDTDATGAPATPEPPEEGAPPDIGDLLSSLGGELGGGSPAEPTPGDENLDLSALFGEEEGPALAHPQKPRAAAGLGRQKKSKPPRLPKQPKERRPRRAEPEPSPEEFEALEELAAPAEEAAPLEEFPPTGEAIAPLGELEPAEELPAPDEWLAPGEDTVEPLGEPDVPFLETAEPLGEPPLPAEREEFLEAPPEFMEPIETVAEAETEAGPTAEEALLKPLEGAEELPSLTGDLDQFSVLPDETAQAEQEGPLPEAPEDQGATAVEEIGLEAPSATPESDLSSLEPGVTHSDLPDIGGLDELNLPEEGEPAAALPRTSRSEPRPAARAEPPRRGPPRRPARPLRERPLRAAADEPAGAGEAAAGFAASALPVGDIDLTDTQFDRLRGTLGILPRNLKIAVQDIVAGAASPTADLAALIGLLVSGAGPKEIAALAGKITGKRIRIPAAYERRTGLALEREQRTFAYAFRQNILPLVRLFVLAVVAAGLAGFVGYRYVWQPLRANSNYRRGYAELQAGRYPLANERFARAVKARPMRRWYFRYAEGFGQKREYALAAEKYEALLDHWPNDRKAVLDWSAMESKQRASYRKANEILQRFLEGKPSDYDALLAAGDNFLEWAGEEPTRYEDARLSWARLMNAHGHGDEVLFRMLRYFVRTDDLEDAERLRALFFDRRRLSVKVEAARSLAELGGYLLDKRQLDWVHDVLQKAAGGAPDLPDVAYQFARFYREMDQPRLEEQWLARAVGMLRDGDGASALRDVEMYLDAQTRLGEFYYGERQYLDASRELKRAVGLVEDSAYGGRITADQRKLRPSLGRLLGRPYAKLADISYYVEGLLADAAAGYRKAADYGYTGPEINYKLGYIAYATGEWLAALEQFSVAEEGLGRAAFAAPGDEAVGARAASSPGRVPINLLFAQGNAFYRRGDLFAAQGSWLRVLEAVETRISAIGGLSPLTRPDHRALLEYRMRADNNLGVATARLAGRTGDRRRTSEALVYLTSAAETADLLARAPDTLAATEAKSLPALNMRGVLYPLADFELQIYKAIPRDLETNSF